MCVCHCMTAAASSGEAALAEFSELRENCDALKQVLLPDDAWPDFSSAYERTPGDVPHASLLALAFECGYLGQITAPIHQFLLGDFAAGRSTAPGYTSELRELWMLQAHKADRHQHSNRYRGKLTELQVARHLAGTDWRVVDLEALSSASGKERRPDILAVDALGVTNSVEVKLIGLSSEGFKAYASRETHWIDTHDRANFLLDRLYRSADQLRPAEGLKVACVALTDAAWREYEPVLTVQRLIDWCNPRFLVCGKNSGWHARYRRLKSNYGSVDCDLAEVILSLDQVVIWRFDNEFSLHEVLAQDLSAP